MKSNIIIPFLLLLVPLPKPEAAPIDYAYQIDKINRHRVEILYSFPDDHLITIAGHNWQVTQPVKSVGKFVYSDNRSIMRVSIVNIETGRMLYSRTFEKPINY